MTETTKPADGLDAPIVKHGLMAEAWPTQKALEAFAHDAIAASKGPADGRAQALAEAKRLSYELASYGRAFVDGPGIFGEAAVLLKKLAALVPSVEPVAWQVWWGLIDMQPHWPPFKTRIEAYAHASSIKSNTEVRPLYGKPGASVEPVVAREGVSEPAPENNLPDWDDCALRVANSEFIAKRIAEGGYGADTDSKLATQLHRFIYEYDDADPYRSAWFMHRLELLVNEIRDEALASQPPAPQAGVREPAVQVAEPEPMFYGRWHHGNGNLCCGSMRYFRADFDTNPAPDVRDGIFDWVCTTMNAALDRWREQKRAREVAEDEAAPLPQQAGEPKVGEPDPYFGVQDEVYLTRAVSVMNDVLGDISGWEDTALADAVKSSKVDLCAMIECIRMRADDTYVPGSKPIDGEHPTPPASPATQPAPALPVSEASADVAKMVEAIRHAIGCELASANGEAGLRQRLKRKTDAAIDALGAAVQPAAQPVGEAQAETAESVRRRVQEMAQAIREGGFAPSGGAMRDIVVKIALAERAIDRLAARPQPEPSGWLPTNEEIELFAAKLVRENGLLWLGFREDEDGRFTIPVVSQSVCDLVRAVATLGAKHE